LSTTSRTVGPDFFAAALRGTLAFGRPRVPPDGTPLAARGLGLAVAAVLAADFGLAMTFGGAFDGAVDLAPAVTRVFVPVAVLLAVRRVVGRFAVMLTSLLERGNNRYRR
jgi:hypothetical protein